MKYLFSLLLLCQIIGLSAKERVDSILSVLDSEIETVKSTTNRKKRS